MPQRLIICAAQSRSQANRIVGHLINGGFAEDAVSIVFADKTGGANSTRKKHLSAASALAASAGVGALLGGAFVWLSGSGILSVPGLGSLIIAGTPLLAAMSQFTRGGLGEMLGNMGLSKDEAVFYEAKLRCGDILISVSVSGGMEAIAAKQIIRAIGLADIADTAEKAELRAGAEQKGIKETILELGSGCDCLAG